MAAPRLRIALLAPTYWPEVRRGTERLVHDLAISLAGAGDEVAILTTHPGPAETSVEDGVHVVRSRRPPKPPRSGDQEYFIETAPVTAAKLLDGGYDLAHAFFPVQAWAAVQAKRLGGPPVAFSFHGIPVRQFLVTRRRRMELVSAAVRGADSVSVLSRFAAEPYRRYLLREPRVLPGGLFCDDFEVDAERTPHPSLICAASLNDPRKGGKLLLEAFALARERVPEARLLLAGGRNPFLGGVELGIPEGVELFDGDDTAVLARAYARSWASVLPAVGEAFGLVLLESMAAGTPPIALRTGGSAELLAEGPGSLVEQNHPEALADALVSALAAPPEEKARRACRARAREYDWARVRALYDEFHEDALAGAAASRAQ